MAAALTADGVRLETLGLDGLTTGVAPTIGVVVQRGERSVDGSEIRLDLGEDCEVDWFGGRLGLGVFFQR